MKVEQLLPGSKPSPSRGGKSGVSKGKPTGFSGALTEARRKPEPKPAETEAAETKKPVPAKKSRATKDQPAAADDAMAAEEAAPANDAKAPAAVDRDEPSADADAPIVTDESEASPKSDLIEVGADPSALMPPQPMGPQVPTVAAEPVAETDGEASQAQRRPICPMPKVDRPAAQARPQAVNGDAESTEMSGVSLDVAGTVLEGVEDADDTPLRLDDVDAELDAVPVVKAPAAPAKQAAAPVVPVERGETTKSEASPGANVVDEGLPTISSEFAFAADVQGNVDEMGPSPVTQGGQDAAATSPPTHVQADLAKTERAPTAPAAPAPLPPQAHFVEANHPKIVTAVRGELLPHGGTMQIRLDPPELGALMVSVHMQDGVMTASFHTSNDDATRLLSHSLSQLKQVLESQGVSVERLHVQQSPRDQQAQSDDQREQHQRDQQDDAARQEQQRKEMLRRMWRRLAMGSDPLDLVA